MGAARELKDLYTHLGNAQTKHAIDKFCADQGTLWSFVPEHAPHFGGLWEAAVKSLKRHFQCIVGDIRLMFEELATILGLVEACLNSRPLTPLPQPEDGIEILTPGHFLITQSLEALPTQTHIIVASLASLPSRDTSPMATLVTRVFDQPPTVCQMESRISELILNYSTSTLRRALKKRE